MPSFSVAFCPARFAPGTRFRIECLLGAGLSQGSLNISGNIWGMGGPVERPGPRKSFVTVCRCRSQNARLKKLIFRDGLRREFSTGAETYALKTPLPVKISR
jgi:hypothetical protein